MWVGFGQELELELKCCVGGKYGSFALKLDLSRKWSTRHKTLIPSVRTCTLLRKLKRETWTYNSVGLQDTRCRIRVGLGWGTWACSFPCGACSLEPASCLPFPHEGLPGLYLPFVSVGLPRVKCRSGTLGDATGTTTFHWLRTRGIFITHQLVPRQVRQISLGPSKGEHVAARQEPRDPRNQK